LYFFIRFLYPIPLSGSSRHLSGTQAAKPVGANWMSRPGEKSRNFLID